MKESRPKAPKSRDSRRSNQRQEWPELGEGELGYINGILSENNRELYMYVQYNEWH